MDDMGVTTMGSSHKESVDGEFRVPCSLSCDIKECSLNQACEEVDESKAGVEDKNTKEYKTHNPGSPKIGMEFETEQHAYDFYDDYGRRVGFNIRKEWRNKNKRGIIIRRKMCCSREGTNFDCKAHIVIAILPNGKYRIVDLEATHNHHCTPNETRMSKSQRKKVAQATNRNITNIVGATSNSTSDFTCAQATRQENVDFLPIDYKNYLRSKHMRSMEKGDARGVLQYLQKMLLDDPGSFYAIQLDVDDQITNIFWADSRMVLDYHAFGDVVCFDTTYRTNNYDFPFAPFVGVNHHKNIVIFGATLMYDETIESFQWLFKAFLDTMSGKHPRTILTDKDKAMTNAISFLMPNTFHRICVCHIYQNAAKHLSDAFNSSRSFDEDFSKCMYDYDDENDFLDAWNNMLDKYNLWENTWLQQLFNEREKWALVYRRDKFCADMQTTLRSESLDNILKHSLHHNHNLFQFLSHFESVVSEKRKAEDEADFKIAQITPILILPLSMLIAARNLYTLENFKLFQEEYGRGMSYVLNTFDRMGPIFTYKVLWVEKNREYTVTFHSVEQTITCGCKRFEFIGILCGHALRVIDHMGLQEVPDRYILKRWRKDAKAGTMNFSCGFTSSDDDKEKMTRRYRELMHWSIKLKNLVAGNEGAFSIALKYSDVAFSKVEEVLRIPQIEPDIIVSKNKGVVGCEGANDNNANINKSVQTSVDETTTKLMQMKGVKRKERGNAM